MIRIRFIIYICMSTHCICICICVGICICFCMCICILYGQRIEIEQRHTRCSWNRLKLFETKGIDPDSSWGRFTDTSCMLLKRPNVLGQRYLKACSKCWACDASEQAEINPATKQWRRQWQPSEVSVLLCLSPYFARSPLVSACSSSPERVCFIRSEPDGPDMRQVLFEKGTFIPKIETRKRPGKPRHQ